MWNLLKIYKNAKNKAFNINSRQNSRETLEKRHLIGLTIVDEKGIFVGVG